MLDFFSHLFDSAGFVPRRDAEGWSPQLVWLHGVCDGLIWLAYLALPVLLIVLARRRRDVPFPWTFWLFGAFILSCGLGHFLDSLATAVPLYRLSGLVKLITAVVSWATVIALVRVAPKALALKNPFDLEREVAQRTAELTRINAALSEKILERRRVERLLRDSEERFRSAFDLAAIGMALVAPDGKWLRVNRALCELVGYPEQELLTADFQSITHPDDLDADLNHVRQMLAGTINTYQMEKRYFHKAGHVVHVLLSVSLVRDGKGEPLYFIAQIQDVTRRKQSEEQTQTSLREKEVLLREIHHRVKNNLQVISSLLDLQARYVRDPDAVVMFRSSQDRVRSMALVHDRLYRSASLSSIDFASYLMNLINHLFAAYGVDHARVQREWALQPVSLPIDAAVPCGLIVNELISNSLKYAFPDGRAGMLRLRLAQEGGEVILHVIDDGVGLPIELGEDVQGARTFGFRLIGALVGQLHGAVRLSRGGEGTSGTSVEVRFPAARKQSERRGDA